MELKNVILQDQWDPVSAFHLLRVLSFQNLWFTFSGLLFKVDFVLPSLFASVWSLLYITSYMREWPFNSRCCRYGDGGPLMPPHPPAPVAVITCFYLIIFHVSFTISAHTCFLRDSKKRHKDVFSTLLLSLLLFCSFCNRKCDFWASTTLLFFFFLLFTCACALTPTSVTLLLVFFFHTLT